MIERFCIELHDYNLHFFFLIRLFLWFILFYYFKNFVQCITNSFPTLHIYMFLFFKHIFGKYLLKLLSENIYEIPLDLMIHRVWGKTPDNCTEQ